MENSAYVPNANHLNSPALVVFSQAASGLQDALRIQRPFNPQFQMSDATKDLHRPFSVSNFGLRHMEAYGGLPAHILNHLQPQFLHPGLSLGSGAFRPLGDLKAFPSPSAFAPPPKCLKIETDNHQQQHAAAAAAASSGGQHGAIFSPATSDERFLGPSPRTDSCSPASASMSPQPTAVGGGGGGGGGSSSGGGGGGAGGGSTAVKEESLDAQMSEDGDAASSHGGPSADNDSPGIHDDGRGFRLGPLFGGGFANGAYAFSLPGLPPAAHNIAKGSFLFDHDLSARNNHTNRISDYLEQRFPNTPIFRDISSQKKKRDPSSCPVCGLAIPAGDLETHFMHELERLYKINGTGIVASRKRLHEPPGRPPALPGDSGPDGRWETFQRIKTNRQGRLRIKLRKRKADDCLICLERGHAMDDAVHHGQHCLNRKPTTAMLMDEDETVDVEGDSEVEEWAEGQRRRTDMLMARQRPTPTSSTTTAADAEADDVIVDGDDPEEDAAAAAVFGPSQYTESDVVVKEAPSKDGGDTGVQSSQVATVNSSGDVERVKVESHGAQQCDSNVSTSDAEPSSRAQMIEELRNRIRRLEAEGGGDSTTTTTTTTTHLNTDVDDYKCLICLEHYKKPVISTVCWHVHCEECWLHTLGSKKVCPQCSMITSPSDLRRIFM